jgi:hypothetical protein
MRFQEATSVEHPVGFLGSEPGCGVLRRDCPNRAAAERTVGPAGRVSRKASARPFDIGRENGSSKVGAATGALVAEKQVIEADLP